MKKEKLKRKYKILLNKELGLELETAAKKNNMTTEAFISQIVNKYFISLHTINKEDMAKGYEEMAQINLELAK